MNQATMEALSALRDALSSDPRMKRLKEAERALESDPQAQKLAKEKENKARAYEEARFTYGEESEQAKQAWRSLYLIKKELDELPSSEAYWKAYAPMASLYRQMDSTLFDPFRDETACGGKL